MHVVTLATVMIVTGVETKTSDVTVTSVVTPTSGVTVMSGVTDECCDPGDFYDCDRCGD